MKETIPKILFEELSYQKEKLKKENYWIAKHCENWVEVQEKIISIEEAIDKLHLRG